MFGLTFEKLFLVAVVAGLVIGPQRLPAYAHRLGAWVRDVRRLLEETRGRAEHDLGVPLRRAAWEPDLRRYDPRRIVREALDDDAAPAPVDPALLEEASRVRPGQRFLVTGSAAHPRRVPLDSLPEDDPRRLAAVE